ncbi:hypothetical protein BC937DRAFT_92809 [Endogone sp. FLAS-F59071]|nr:hypothetical protein BC937DRAFT_92809 [Endogone sp. FLAS-F59071]|eukprot:RUS21393.1 hypothetical protein BC937DRAFT_92809 [Endogone sp. FLAS-F59071]
MILRTTVSSPPGSDQTSWWVHRSSTKIKIAMSSFTMPPSTGELLRGLLPGCNLCQRPSISWPRLAPAQDSRSRNHRCLTRTEATMTPPLYICFPHGWISCA